ncbi:MAG: DUF2946 family protein [Xanthobacteraceae bacterium]
MHRGRPYRVPMATIRQYRALIAWLGLVALIGNLVTGMFCSAPAKRIAADFPVELVGAMVICSEHGAQTVPDDGTAPPQKPCQICIAAAGLLLTLVLAALFALLPLAPTERIAFAIFPFIAHRYCRAGLGSRAPPLPA